MRIRFTPKQAAAFAHEVLTKANQGRAVEVTDGDGRDLGFQFDGQKSGTIGGRGKVERG